MIFVAVLLAFVACVRGLPGHVRRQRVQVSQIQPAYGLFHVYALPVGQGDARVIQCPSGEISIIDMGSCSSATGGFWTATEIKSFLHENFHLVTNIFITHNDRDHYNLLDKVFESSADVSGLQSIYISRKISDMDNRIQNWVNNIGVTSKVKLFNKGDTCGSSSLTNTPCDPVTLCPGDAGITTRVLSVNAGLTCSSESTNANSIVIEITYGSFKLQLNGDFEDCTTRDNENGPLKKMADKYYSNENSAKLTVYMLAHHGAARLANKKVIRDAVKPKAVFVSANTWYGIYKHPRCAVTDAFISEVGSLCKPGETDPASPFYCGQHPIDNLPLTDTLQSTYTCGDDDGKIKTKDSNVFAIYSTRPDETQINLVHLLTNGDKWGFINNISPLITVIKRQRSRESRATEDDECADESSNGFSGGSEWSAIDYLICYLLVFLSGAFICYELITYLLTVLVNHGSFINIFIACLRAVGRNSAPAL